MDTTGLIFAGMAVLFLIAILFGHQKREHMSNQQSAWDNIRYELETELKELYDFDIAQFRSSVISQNNFFEGVSKPLEKLQSVFGVPMTKPTPAEVKNTEKLFDEKIRILKEDLKTYKKKGSITADATTKLAISSLTTLAKVYMFDISGAAKFKPKSGLSTISKIIG